ncbi:DNA polymerase eta isoform X1 [Psammomys obesus]|uniref:DNA polymerase eta isoform X1 n=1 Tax=Psammomys obesus TaxID=48139 RepID=UPI00245362F4|nr:DNA polymerase eta isoform X1 [Psammomys obesus]XP_055468812.1 DNA polymerase eta isoform X1 [Psammomys obesus]
MAPGQDRVVALVDMDCFFVQVEQRQNPHLRNKPCAVVQYKTWKGGGIIAVSYEARAFGVTRNMWADDAKKLCPDLLLAQVRESRGKANLTKYREASVEVMEIMSHFAVIERASIDEAYIDLTSAVQERLQKFQGQPISADLLPSTYIEGLPRGPAEGAESVQKEDVRKQGLLQWLGSLQIDDSTSPDLHLTVGAVIVEEMRAAIERKTGFQCSAGISHNKVLAKLACGLNKPNRQTLVSHGSVPQLFSRMPVRKIRSLGGKLGASVIKILGVEYMGELTQFTESQLQNHFGEKNGSWLYAMCRGIEHDPVKPRQLPKTIGCSKNFPGKTALATREQVQWWLLQLALELEERLTKDRSDNDRVATQLVVSIRVQGDQRLSSLRRCCALSHYDAHKMSQDAFAAIRNCNTSGIQTEWSPPLTMLFLCATKFSASAPSACTDITVFLNSDSSCQSKVPSASSETTTQRTGPAVPTSKKAATSLESFFQKAAKKQRLKEISSVPLNTSIDKPPSKPSLLFQNSQTTGAEPFFKQKSLLLQQAQLRNPVAPDPPQTDSEVEPSCLPTESVGAGPVYERVLKLVPSKAISTETDVAVDSPDVLEPSAYNSQEVARRATEDQVLCDKCDSLVPVWDMPEHTDYHFAVELQKSFSQPCTSKPQAAPTMSPQGKRTPKSPLASRNKRLRPPGMQTLESFFKPLTH